ncbi:MAG TPA: phosphate ABC transporter substrate-binding protein PstS [Bryobacteraceae bacterium]|nr:phosphate ABC transporter substrate-binding protein PstS [Bryobacteraceae bacterium]
MKMRMNLALAAMGGFVLVGVAAGATVSINAAGATFPDPIYKRWFEDYRKLTKDGVQVNYQAIGSGGGIRQLQEGTVDFGASDMPMHDPDIAKMKVKPLHFPTVLGGVVPIYNVPGVSDLKFSGDLLADIYLGKVTKWNDPAIAKENPGVKLPASEIIPVYRSDGSGTTFTFTDFLSKVSPEWKSKVGVNDKVNFPAGTGAPKNDGVAGMVKQTPGTIGYVELIYAASNKIPYGAVKNAAGNYLKADVNTVTAAAAGAAKNMPDDFRVSITNAPGKEAYPISTFTWLLIPSRIEDPAKRKAVTDFLKWMLVDGQKAAAGLNYAPLPKEVVAKEEKQIAKVQ